MSSKEKDKLFKMFLMTHDMYDHIKKKLNETIPTQILNETLQNILTDPSLNDYDKWLKYKHNLVKLATQLRDKPVKQFTDTANGPIRFRDKAAQTGSEYLKSIGTNVNMGSSEQVFENDANFNQLLDLYNRLNQSEEDRQQKTHLSAQKKARLLKMRGEIRAEHGLEEHEHMDPIDLDSAYKDDSIYLDPDSFSTPLASASPSSTLNLIQLKQKGLKGKSLFQSPSKIDKTSTEVLLPKRRVTRRGSISKLKPSHQSLTGAFYRKRGMSKHSYKSVAEHYPKVKTAHPLSGKGLPLSSKVNKWDRIFK